MAFDVFVSSDSHSSDYSGVFEHDGDVGYFYLCRTAVGGESKIIESLCVMRGVQGLVESDFTVKWDRTGAKVGLFIRGVLWSLYDVTAKTKHGGLFAHGQRSTVPVGIFDSDPPSNPSP